MNTAMKSLIFASLPERSDDLDAHWKEYDPQFNLSEDKAGFYCEGGAYGLVLFTSRTMEMLWLLGFASWKAMYSYGGLLVKIHGEDKILDMKETSTMPDQAAFDKEYDRLIEQIYELAKIENLNDFKWPDGIPTPETGRPSEEEEALVFDLICMATAYVFLHEVQHIKFTRDGTTLSRLEEEMECDRFARELMLTKLEECSGSYGWPVDKLRTKRGMSLSLATFFLLVITPKDRWGETETHPSLSERIAAFADDIALSDSDCMWVFLACLVIAQLRYQKCIPNRIQFTSFRDLCMQLIVVLPS